MLRTKLVQVERDLNMIHDKGRHDYSEAKKGFMIWKGLLDEKLF